MLVLRHFVLLLGVTVHQTYQQQSNLLTCEETYTADRFSISLPARSPAELFECRFLIRSASPDICQLRINFKKLGLSRRCKEQFLQIGSKTICGSIFGTQLFPFNSNSTLIQYRSDGSNPLDIEVEQVRCQAATEIPSCDVTTTNQTIEISSPGYPEPYASPISCLYTIHPSPEGSCQVSVNFLDFNIPESPSCLAGRLLLDGEPYCGLKSGHIINKNTTTGLTFDFSQGSSQSPGRYHLKIEQSHCPRATSANQLLFSPPLCCEKVFRSKNFLLTSPGFLQIQPTEGECIYQIQQLDPRFCRLRLNFLHFWLGQEDVYYGCTDGFLEVDGRRICGCNDGLSLVSFFDIPVKELYFNTRGVPGKGFLIEVIQEDCSLSTGRSFPEPITENPDSEVEVFSTNSTVEKVQSRFFVPRDDSKCLKWSLPQFVDNVKRILQTAPNLCPPIPSLFPPAVNPINPPQYPPSNPIIPPYLPPVCPKPPLFPPISPPIFPPLDPPVYPPVTPSPPIRPPVNPPFPPVNPPIYPPPARPPVSPPVNPPIYPPPTRPPIYPPVYPPLYPSPPISPPINPQPPPLIPPIYPPPVGPPVYPPIFPPPFPGRCRVFSDLQGNLQSPGYPWNYPPNQKCCYRVRQAVGFCRLQVSVLDFDVAWSPKCWKDYLLLDQSRFCGQMLQSSIAFIPFRNGYAVIDFITDKYFSGRGFRAVYRQLPCNGIARSDDRKPPPEPYPHPTTAAPLTTPPFDLNVTPV